MTSAFLTKFREYSRKSVSVSLAAVVAFLSFATPVRAAEPNDPLYKDQAYASVIGLPDAWNYAKGSPTVRVAILDTGIDLTHPDLKDRIWTNRGEIPGDGIDNDRNGYVDDVHGWDFVNNDADPNPDLSNASQSEGVHHGTLVAGIIGAAGNNAEGISGVNWNVELMPLRVLGSDGSGRTAAVQAAIRYAMAQKAQVINISFAGPGYSDALAETLRAAYRAGVVIVAAAGNEGDTAQGGNLNVHPAYPICYRGAANEQILIGVSSLDAQGRHSSFSSYGSDCTTVSAPGENIVTTQVFRTGSLTYAKAYGNGWSGSSLAAPIVSGVAALLLSLNPSLTPSEVRTLITSRAVNVDSFNGGYGGQLGAGRIDAAASVAAVVAQLLNAPLASVPVQGVDAPLSVGGELVKSAQFSTVYYKAPDGKRYVFPNSKTYATWFKDFASVRTISSTQLASLPLGGTITYRPGTRLIKLRTRPEVYAVGKGGVLRHIASEDVAKALYGASWRTQVDDLPDEFFAAYRLGPDVIGVADYDPGAEKTVASSIEADRGLTPAALSKP